MTAFFPDIRAAAGALQQEAFTRWQAMGDLRRREHWRWTPLDALRDDARRSEGADYQFDLPDAIGEDFGTFTEADRALLALDDAAFAALNLALLPDALQLTVPDGADLDAIAEFIEEQGGVVGEGYENPTGEGRITILTE